MEVKQEMLRYDRVRHINVYISKIHFLNEHMHGSFELGYVLEGSAKFVQGTQTRLLQPGTMVLMNPYEPHSFVAQGEKPLVLLTLQIHKLFARRYVENIPRLKFNGSQIEHLPPEQHDKLLQLLFQTTLAYLGNSPSQQYDVIGYAIQLMGKLVTYLEWELESNPDSSDKELQKNRVQRLISYIDENYRQKITLSMLADMEGISATYLSHFFRKTFGVSFQQYLTAQRFEKALVLMHDPAISMVDICMNCGFSDSRYLEAACQRTFGCSVLEYRKRCQSLGGNDTQLGDNVLYKRCERMESIDMLKEYLGCETFELLS